MAFSSLKGTRKTYSFEERELLITLINKYEDVEDKKADPVSMRKRKAAWSQLAEEYNATVGPQGTRTAVQLRRCWENMKACKRNREEKKSRTALKNLHQASKDHGYKNGVDAWENSIGGSTSETSKATGTVGLPPNIVFEPNESEPFTLQSVCPTKPPKLNVKKESDVQRDSGIGSSTTASTIVVATPSETAAASCGSASDCCADRSGRDYDSPTTNHAERTDDDDDDDEAATMVVGGGAGAGRGRAGRGRDTTTTTALVVGGMRERLRKTRRSAQREEEARVLALSEARMRADTAAMLKEEARVKLEEAHYRKEEARLRMVFITYKLDRIKQD